jgi:hypothetical protein
MATAANHHSSWPGSLLPAAAVTTGGGGKSLPLVVDGALEVEDVLVIVVVLAVVDVDVLDGIVVVRLVVELLVVVVEVEAAVEVDEVRDLVVEAPRQAGADVLLTPGNTMVGMLGSFLTKSAQVMRVVLPRWRTKDRLPKNAASPSLNVANLSTYSATNGSLLILPYFPAKSPTWQEEGSLASQSGLSARFIGSKWPPVAVQLPPVALLTWR